MKVRDLFEYDEEDDSTSSDVESNEYHELINAIKKYCPNNFKSLVDGSAPALYRGDRLPHEKIDSSRAYAISLDRNEPRKSLTGNSFINSYVSSSPDWRAVPSRLYATICTPDYDVADTFGGRPYLIIPFDNVKTFAHIQQDWNDIGGEWGEIDTLNNRFKTLRINISDMNSNMSKDTFNKLPESIRNNLETRIISAFSIDVLDKTQIDKIFDIFQNLYLYFKDEPELAFIKNYLKWFGRSSLSEWMSKNITPESFGVKLINGYRNLKDEHDDATEIWFNGKFIALACVGDTLYPNTAGLADSDWLKNLAKKI
jgi:hypothetical protein